MKKVEGGRKEKGEHRIRQGERGTQKEIQKTEVIINATTKFFSKVTGVEKHINGECQNIRIGEHRDAINGI